MKIFLFVGIITTFMACKSTSTIEDKLVATSPVNGTVSAFNFKLDCEEAKFVSLLNLYRQQNGLNEIQVSQSGVLATRFHAEDMISKNYFSHTEPDGRTFYNRALDFGYPAWSENIAAGNVTANDTFCQWKNSPGHNTNMLKPEHQSIGIGRAIGGTYGAYWSNDFGPGTGDLLEPPLNTDTACVMPGSLPNC